MNKKLKQLLVLVTMLSTYSYATCTKQEVMKLIDKGFSKTEISSICDIQSKTATSTAKPKSKWIIPARRACTKNGGKLKSGGICAADWYSAKRICSAAGGKLPTINELKSVVTGCGGEINDYKNNENDSFYQSCYKQKGFSSLGYYWSSSIDRSSDIEYVWRIYFKDGTKGNTYKSDDGDGCYYVRCVRGRQ